MIGSLQSICQAQIIKVLEQRDFDARLINDLCKYVPEILLEPIFNVILEKGVITDTALMAFLVPTRLTLRIHSARSIRNNTFKQIGFNCPNLMALDLSDCAQVGNSVIRAILQGCPMLENMRLDRCHRITDSAFDVSESPFHFLFGCLSLQAISLQGCPQITGEIITTLNKNCRRLTYLNLSQCKNVKSPKIQHIFQHSQLQNLNLGFIEDISDEAFLLLPTSGLPVLPSAAASVPFGVRRISPLQKLNLCKSKITDSSIFKMSCLIALLEIRLQWCTGITDKGVRSLVRNCPKLRLLDLKSCAVTDDSLASIAEMCTELRELDLSWCPGFSEAGLLQLVPVLRSGMTVDGASVVRGAQCLERLCLEWCLQITDRTLRALHALPTLNHVQLAGCAGVTSEGVKWLRRTGRVVES